MIQHFIFLLLITCSACGAPAFKSGQSSKSGLSSDNQSPKDLLPGEQPPGGVNTDIGNEPPGAGVNADVGNELPGEKPTQVCKIKKQAFLYAGEGMYNRNPSCGPTGPGSIDLVTNPSATFAIPANAKKAKIITMNVKFLLGNCSAVVAAYNNTKPLAPYSYSGLCQRTKPDFELPFPIQNADLNLSSAATSTLAVFCKTPQLVSRNMGQNAAGYEVAGMEAHIDIELSYEVQGACPQP